MTSPQGASSARATSQGRVLAAGLRAVKVDVASRRWHAGNSHGAAPPGARFLARDCRRRDAQPISGGAGELKENMSVQAANIRMRRLRRVRRGQKGWEQMGWDGHEAASHSVASYFTAPMRFAIAIRLEFWKAADTRVFQILLATLTSRRPPFISPDRADPDLVIPTRHFRMPQSYRSRVACRR
jgi:hypothetical protein